MGVRKEKNIEAPTINKSLTQWINLFHYQADWRRRALVTYTGLFGLSVK